MPRSPLLSDRFARALSIGLFTLSGCLPGPIAGTTETEEGESSSTGDGDGDVAGDGDGDGDGDPSGDGDGDPSGDGDGDPSGDGDGDPSGDGDGDPSGDGDGDPSGDGDGDPSGDGDGDPNGDGDGDPNGDGDGDPNGDGDGDPQPPSGFAPQDGFDPIHDRWFVYGEDNANIVAVDMQTGEQTEIVEAWPWPEEDLSSIASFSLDEEASQAYTFVSHSYLDPDENGGYCVASLYVSVDLEDGSVLPLVDMGEQCCDDCGAGSFRISPVIDASHDLLRTVYADCDPNACDYYLRSNDPLTLDLDTSHFLYDGYCDDDDPENCNQGILEARPIDHVVDPRSDAAMLMLLRGGSLMRIDHTNGTAELELAITPDWDGVTLDLDHYRQWGLLDHAQGRVFVTTRVQQQVYATVRVDLETSEQSLLYGGEAIEGEMIDCLSEMAYDPLADRVLYRTVSAGNCVESFFAVDVESGVGEHLFVP